MQISTVDFVTFTRNLGSKFFDAQAAYHAEPVTADGVIVQSYKLSAELHGDGLGASPQDMVLSK